MSIVQVSPHFSLARCVSSASPVPLLRGLYALRRQMPPRARDVSSARARMTHASAPVVAPIVARIVAPRFLIALWMTAPLLLSATAMAQEQAPHATSVQAPVESGPATAAAGASAPVSAPVSAVSSADGPAPLTDRQFDERAKAFDAREHVLDKRTSEMNYRYAVAQHDCYSRFFVNDCLDKARDAMRVEKGDIRTARLALSDERRSDRARKRDQDEAAARQRDLAEAPQRAQNEQRNRAAFDAKQQQHAEQAARRGDDAALRANNVAAYDKKQADHQALIDEAHRNAAADAEKRAQNVSRFDQKQKDAADRQAQLVERQRQAQERAAKQQADQQQQGKSGLGQ